VRGPPRHVRLTDRLLVRGGLRVSPVCLGRVPEEGPRPSSDDTACAAFDAGVNFFFVTADLHWRAYDLQRRSLRKLLSRRRSLRDEVVVAVAAYSLNFPLAAVADLFADLPELDRRVDVLVAGGLYARDAPHLDAFREYASAIDAPAVGATFHDRACAASALRERRVDVGFVRYNPRHDGARRDVLAERAAFEEARVFAFKTTFGAEDAIASAAAFIPRIQDYYRFALARPEVDGILAKLRTPGEVLALARALEEPPLSADEEARLLELAKSATPDR